MDTSPSRITIEFPTVRQMSLWHGLLPLAMICFALPPATAAELLIPGIGPPTQLLQALATHFNERAGHLQVALPGPVACRAPWTPSAKAARAQVTVRSLSPAQLAAIFAGTLTDWGQLCASARTPAWSTSTPR